MLYLVLGLVLFVSPHLIATVGMRPRLVSALGEGPYKGIYSLVSAVGLVLIIFGFGAYRAAGYIPIYNPPHWINHLVALLMWPTLIILCAAFTPVGLIKSKLKHPMLVSVKAWAFLHLLANGDLGSILLFGSFLAFGVVARISLKKRGDLGVPAPAPFGRGDAIAIVAGTVLTIVIAFWLHLLLIGVPVVTR
jgi:uncharacterized membrane protein